MAGIKIRLSTDDAQQASNKLKANLKQLGYEALLNERQLAKLEQRTHTALGSAKAKKAMQDLQQGLRLTRLETARLQRQMGDTRGALTTLTGGFKGMAAAAFSLKSAFAAMGLAVIARDIMKTGTEFQLTMAKVKGVTNANQKDFEALTAVAKKMGETTSWSASESADALQFLGMAGFQAVQAVGALPDVLDLATSGSIDLGMAADIASNALTAMRLPIEDLKRVNDVFIKTITSSNTNMEMMAESFKYSAPLAAALGYEIETLSAYIGLLGNAGIQGSMAGTQLSFAFQRLPDVFEKLGVSIQNADGSTKDLTDALQLLEEKGADTTTVMEIFGDRGGKAVLSLLGMGSKAVREFIENIEDSEDAAKKLKETIANTTHGAFKELKSAIEGVEIDIFEQQTGELVETIKEMTSHIRDNKSVYVDFANVTFQLALNATKAATAFANLVLSIKELGSVHWDIEVESLDEQIAKAKAEFNDLSTELRLRPAETSDLYEYFFGSTEDLAVKVRMAENNVKRLLALKRLGNVGKAEGQPFVGPLEPFVGPLVPTKEKKAGSGVEAKAEELSELEKLIAGLKKEEQQLGMTTLQRDLDNVSRMEGSKSHKAQAQALLKSIAALELEKNKTEEMAQAKKEAAAYIESLAPSLDESAAAIKRLTELQQQGIITQQEYTQGVNNLNDSLEKIKRDEASEWLKELENPTEQYANRVEELDGWLKKAWISQDQFNLGVQRAKEKYEDFVKSTSEVPKKTGWEQYFENIGTEVDMLNRATLQAAYSMENTLSDVLFDGMKNGFENTADIFQDMADDMLQIFTDMIAQMIMKWAAARLFGLEEGGAGGPTNYTGKTGDGGWLGMVAQGLISGGASLLSGIGSSPNTGANELARSSGGAQNFIGSNNDFAIPLEYKARGGNLAANTPYVVGDGGRSEVFVPQTNGYLHPSTSAFKAAQQTTNNSMTISVPVTVNGQQNKNLASNLRQEIEATVARVVRRNV